MSILTRQSGVKKTVDFSCIKVVYRSINGSWRGFIDPYDISIEASTQKKASEALDEMLDTYLEILEESGHPEHLIRKRLTNDEDHNKLLELAFDALQNKGIIKTDDLYAETKAL